MISFSGRGKARVAVALVAGCFAVSACAQGYAPVSGYVPNVSVIDGEALGGAQGAIAINMVAGDGNAQMNSAALATSVGRGVAAASVNGMQYTEVNAAIGPSVSVAHIGDGAFARASGLVAVNQASGQGNAQANGVAMAMGIEGDVLAESELSAAISGQGLVDPGHDGTSVQHVSVDDTAFAGAQGVFQVNQLAGTGNATANNLTLRIKLGGGQ